MAFFFLFFRFLKTFQSETNFLTFGVNIIWRSTTFSKNKMWCQMINSMCTAFRMWHNITFQNQFRTGILTRFSKIFCILLKISTPRNWYPYSIYVMLRGNRASSYENMARNFRTSMAFDWEYFLQTETIRTTDAQQWLVVGTSVAGKIAVAFCRIFDITERTVRDIAR